MKFTDEQLIKAKAAKSAEELLTIAKENGIELTANEAAKFFADLNRDGEVADDELANVAGGCGGPKEYEVYANWAPPGCGKYTPIPGATDTKCGTCEFFDGWNRERNDYAAKCLRETKSLDAAKK